MTPEAFRRHAHAAVDWMADYLATIEERPVLPDVAPGAVAGRLPDSAPEDGEPMAAILADFREIIAPAMTHWQHPSFFAYFPANASPPSVLAEMLTAVMGAQCMSWQTSPAATELEGRVMAWLGQMIGLPEDFTGVIQDTASTATLCALLTARERASGFAVTETGLREAPAFTVYASDETHSSIEKAVRIAGLGRTNLRALPSDETGALRVPALAAAIAADRAAGKTPLAVVATLGTTGVGAFDPLAEIAAIARAEGLWLHVDAAWAGSALILPEARPLMAGIEAADSLVVNPHKWLMTNFDCSAYFVRDSDALVRTFSVLPEYLRTAEGGEVVNYRDWGIQLGRRFRALKLWFVIRAYGVEGLRAMLRRHVALTRWLAEAIAGEPDFELVAAPRLALLCFRHRPDGLDEAALDSHNAALLERLNRSGRLYLSHTRFKGRYAIRVAIGQRTTEHAHVAAAWEAIRTSARALWTRPQ